MRDLGNYDTRRPSRSTQVIAAVDRTDMRGWNRAMVGAFKRGASDYLNGKKMSDCPYQDKRKPNGRLTWSRAFQTAWSNGWRLAHYTLTGENSDEA